MRRHAIASPTRGWLFALPAAAFALLVLTASAGVEIAAAAPPIAETTGAPLRTTTTAQLGGRVDPRGLDTTYFFEYGPQGPCDANPCTATAPQPAGAGDTTVLVAREVSGLEPNTTYHYRLVASNGDPAGPSRGSDMTVTTRASEVPLSHGHFPGPPGSDRAWEQVSPPDAGGNPVSEGVAFSRDGDRALLTIAGGTPTSDYGNLFSVYFSERTPAGWKLRDFLPPRESLSGPPHWGVTADPSLSTIVAANLNESTGVNEIWRLQPEGTAARLFVTPYPTFFLGNYGISDDRSRILMFLAGGLDPKYPASKGRQIYDLTSGSPRLLSLLPDGTTPDCGVFTSGEPSLASRQHVVSADGSLLFFGSKVSDCPSVFNHGGTERIYARDLDAGVTKQITPASVSGPECDSIFLTSTPDAVLFWTKSRMAAGDTDPEDCSNPLDGDVYRYDLQSEGVRCVTCVVPGQDADVYVRSEGSGWHPEWSLLVPEDGSRVYFQSPNALVPGTPTGPGVLNTYRVDVDSGKLAWIAGPGVEMNTVRAVSTRDGAAVLFVSNSPFLNPLNGSDNAGTAQLYRYYDRDRSLVCISCPSDGTPPQQVASMEFGARGYVVVSDDGETVAFVTPTALVDADQNTSDFAQNSEGGKDVYEWRDGRLLLVTDGLTNTTRGTEGPTISGITADGRNVFFIAQAQYTPDALDTYRRLYDARIGGGIAFPKPPPPCPLEACQGTPKGIPEEAAPGTTSFAGPGNLRNRRPRHKKHKARRHGQDRKHRHNVRQARGVAR